MKKVSKIFAHKTGKSPARIATETAPIQNELLARGILSKTAQPKRIESEPVSIANITINLTNKCNLKCSWCYNAGHTCEEMPVNEFMNHIAESKNSYDTNASFIILGGEPFLFPDRLLHTIDRANEIFKSAPLVSTNGTLLNDTIVKELSSRRVNIQVSLDSHNPAVHDSIRGKGTFEKTYKGIQLLASAGIPTTLSMVYTKNNLSDFEQYLELALEIGAKEARFIPLRLIGGGTKLKQLCPDQEKTFTYLLDILDRRPEFKPLLSTDYFSIQMTVCRYSSTRASCGIGRKVIFIDADGSVYPCPNHTGPENICGNIRQRSLTKILMESSILNVFRKDYQVSSYPDCKICPFKHWCAGDCRGEVRSLCGNPFGPSPHCEELKRIFKKILWLLAENDDRLGTVQTLPEGKETKDIFI